MQTIRFRRFLRIGFIAVLSVLVLLALLMAAKPVQFRLYVFQPVREATLFYKEVVDGGPWSHIDTRQLTAAERVVIPKARNTDINIVADLYRPDACNVRMPGILLLHGSSPYGRKAGLVRLFGEAARDRGWVVVAPDARGYGDTDDPEKVNDSASWRVQADIARAISFLVSMTRVDPQRIIVVGHSIGAGHALEGALTDPRVSALVLAGPPRYPDGVDKATRFWPRVRYAADRRLEQPVTVDFIADRIQRTSVATYADDFLSVSGHVPILFIDGENEGNANKAYLAEVVARIHPPVEYMTLSDSGHYFGVRSFFGSDVIYVRPNTFETFLNTVAAFIESELGLPAQDSCRSH